MHARVQGRVQQRVGQRSITCRGVSASSRHTRQSAAGQPRSEQPAQSAVGRRPILWSLKHVEIPTVPNPSARTPVRNLSKTYLPDTLSLAPKMPFQIGQNCSPPGRLVYDSFESNQFNQGKT